MIYCKCGEKESPSDALFGTHYFMGNVTSGRIASWEILPISKVLLWFLQRQGGCLKEGRIFFHADGEQNTGVASPAKEEYDLS
jgi:hypothetical protein